MTAYYVPSTILGTRDTATNKTDKAPAHRAVLVAWKWWVGGGVCQNRDGEKKLDSRHSLKEPTGFSVPLDVEGKWGGVKDNSTLLHVRWGCYLPRWEAGMSKSGEGLESPVWTC